MRAANSTAESVKSTANLWRCAAAAPRGVCTAGPEAELPRAELRALRGIQATVCSAWTIASVTTLSRTAIHHHHTTSLLPATMRVATTTMNRTSVALTIVALCMLLLLALLR